MRRTLLAVVVVHTMQYLFLQIFVMNFTIIFAMFLIGFYRVYNFQNDYIYLFVGTIGKFCLI